MFMVIVRCVIDLNRFMGNSVISWSGGKHYERLLLSMHELESKFAEFCGLHFQWRMN